MPRRAHLSPNPARVYPPPPLGRETEERGGAAAESVSLLPTWFAVAALIAVAALHFVSIGLFPLADPDESRYGEIAREMVLRSDWVTPTLNFVKYFEKPPLVYWMTAASYGVFGIDEFSVRLPALLCGLVVIGLVLALGASMYGRTTGLLAAIVLATSPFPAMLSEAMTLDTPLTCMMTLALVAVWFGHRSAGPFWYRLAYVGTALGVLVKGPVSAVLVAAIAATFLLAAGGWRELRRTVDRVGIALAAAITLPWFVLVTWRNPEFFHFFVVDQHIARYLWTTEHGQPFWYFLVLTPVVLIPWSLLTYTAPSLWRPHLDPRQWSRQTLYLVLWAAVIITFFSLSKSKLLTYILPAIPPLAILWARLIERGLAAGDVSFLRRGGNVLIVLGSGAFLSGAILGFFIHHWRFPLIRPFLFGGGFVLAGVGYLARMALERRGPGAALRLYVAGFVAFLAIGLGGRSLTNSYRELSIGALLSMQPMDRLANYGSFFHGLTFYTGSRAVMVSGLGELDFGSKQGDQRAWFWDDDELRRQWSAPHRMLLAIRPGDLAKLDPPLDPPPIQIAAQEKVVLVANRPPE